jgi:outer membrane biosynthesis protein TonB
MKSRFVCMFAVVVLVVGLLGATQVMAQDIPGVPANGLAGTQLGLVVADGNDKPDNSGAPNRLLVNRNIALGYFVADGNSTNDNSGTPNRLLVNRNIALGYFVADGNSTNDNSGTPNRLLVNRNIALGYFVADGNSTNDNSGTPDPLKVNPGEAAKDGEGDPDCKCSEQPTQSTQEQPTQSTQEQPTQSTQEQPTQSTQEQPTQSTQEQPTQSTQEQPTQSTLEQPGSGEDGHVHSGDETKSEGLGLGLELVSFSVELAAGEKFAETVVKEVGSYLVEAGFEAAGNAVDDAKAAWAASPTDNDVMWGLIRMYGGTDPK